MEYKPIGMAETAMYEVVKSTKELETLLDKGDNADIFVSKDVEITDQHKEIAKEKYIGIRVVKGLNEVKVHTNTSVLNRPLT